MLPMRLAVLTVVLLLGLPGAAHAAATGEQATWHSRQILADRAHKAGFHGKGVTVAILDGWADTSHPDFAGRTRPGADCSTGTCTTTITREDCGQGHGTHVAGTLTSSSYGVANRATLLPVRVLTQDSSGDCAGTPDAVAAGIRWALSRGATVLNLSLGPDVPNSSSSSTLMDAVRDAARADAVVVFSAGNRDLPVAQSYGDNALVVAATRPSGALASYSQHGEGVSVAAPGGEPTANGTCTQKQCITSLYPQAGYAVAAGTSMAAPAVAGLAALLRSAHPDWNAAQIRARIKATARPLAGAGAGLVDVSAALGVAPKATRTPAPAPRATTLKPRATSPASPAPRTPTPRAVPTSAPASPAPVPSRSPAGSTAVVINPSRIAPQALSPEARDSIPLPLAALAGMLVGLAAAAVVVLPRL